MHGAFTTTGKFPSGHNYLQADPSGFACFYLLEYIYLMTAQKQKQPVFHNPFDDSEEEKTVRKPAPEPKKAGRFFTVLGVITACVICTAVGIAARQSTTLFVEKRTVDGYLAPEDYILVREDTGKPVQNARSLSLKHMHSYDNGGMRTTYGIREGSPWELFADAYSDIHADNITYYKNTPDSYSIDYSNSVYLTDPITIAEFNQKYVETGEVNPETDRIYVDFQLYTDGFHLYYTQKELNDALDKYYDTPALLQPVTQYPRSSSYNMTVVFSPDEGVQYITSSYY